MDDLVKAIGAGGMSKSQVGRLCVEIDERVNAFPFRPLEGAWPYPWLDATCVKVREAGGLYGAVLSEEWWKFANSAITFAASRVDTPWTYICAMASMTAREDRRPRSSDRGNNGSSQSRLFGTRKVSAPAGVSTVFGF